MIKRFVVDSGDECVSYLGCYNWVLLLLIACDFRQVKRLIVYLALFI